METEKEWREKEIRERKIEKWREENERKEKMEKIENLKRKVLIIKRGEKANKKMKLEKWIKKCLRVENMKIMRAYGNKEAAKVFFETKIERNEIWEKKRS